MNYIIIILLLVILFYVMSKNRENYSINIKPTHKLSKDNNNNYIKNKNCKDLSETIKNPDDYIKMLQQLFNDLSTDNNIDYSKLNKIDYIEDSKYISTFLNSKINKLINSKVYLQKNNNWKYEQFHTTDFTIKYYISTDFNLFNVKFILANTLRSTYTLCICNIQEKNNILSLINIKLINEDYKNELINLLPLDTIYAKYNNIEVDIDGDIPPEFKSM